VKLVVALSAASVVLAQHSLPEHTPILLVHIPLAPNTTVFAQSSPFPKATITMPDAGATGSVSEPDVGSQHVSNTSSTGRFIYASIATKLQGQPNDLEEYEEDMAVSEITDEDAQSLMELSISQAATRLKSAKTPALEKAAAMDKLEGGPYFDSDLETPLAGDLSGTDSGSQSPAYEPDGPAEGVELHCTEKKNVAARMPLGTLSSPRIEDPVVPITPWHAGPKPMVNQPKSGATQSSSLAGVFNNPRSRSLSGGAEALKKFLPKGLSSMTQMGQMFTSTSSGQKPKTWAISPRSYTYTQSGKSPIAGSQNHALSPPSQAFQSVITTRLQPESIEPPNGVRRPQTLRRVTSDDSLLYHSLSRASSLGDDTRFENHHEQVNSRVKAIRDSLQDRSSFRMPQMPSLPSMPRVPNFSFNMNFLNSSSPPARWKSDTDIISDILPGTITKKKPDAPLSCAPRSIIATGLVGAAVARPQTVVAASRFVTDSPPASHLDRALEHLTGDVVIMGGYRGSILRSTKTNRQVWVPVKVGLNIRKVDLEVGLEPEDEERMEETIYPSGMLQNIGPVDISRRLFKRLSECENARNGKLRVWDYGYDWRLSPHLLSRKLTEFLEKLPSNLQTEDRSVGNHGGALVIAHSLGGLITRHVVNQRPDLFSGVVYAGVPQACVNILGPLRNGDAVLLSSRVLTAQVNFTLRTSFLLLPEDGGCFIDINTKEKYKVDFFNIDDWIKYRWSPCTDPPLPPRNQQPAGGLGGLLNRSGSLLSLQVAGRKPSASGDDENSQPGPQSPPTKTTYMADIIRGSAEGGTDRTLGFEMGTNSNPVTRGHSINTSVSTTVTIPRTKAIAYLKRTLADTVKFKKALHFDESLSTSNRYPPLALIYGKSIPTVYGAKVDGREGIPCSDSYDNLAFASGDGVCLAKEAMLPPGYKVVHGGRISSDRGHVTLLGDLNAVGRAIDAVSKGRRKGIGLGIS
jgi:hypothetical protein